VLDTPENGLGDVEDLTVLGVFDRGIREVVPTGPTVGQQVVDDLIGVRSHRQVRSRCSGLYPSTTIHVVFALRLDVGSAIRTGLCRLGPLLRRVGRRWHRRVLRTLVQALLQLGDHAGQTVDLSGLRRVLRTQCDEFGFELLPGRLRHA
jgi:hypothetical protein